MGSKISNFFEVCLPLLHCWCIPALIHHGSPKLISHFPSPKETSIQAFFKSLFICVHYPHFILQGHNILLIDFSCTVNRPAVFSENFRSKCDLLVIFTVLITLALFIASKAHSGLNSVHDKFIIFHLWQQLLIIWLQWDHLSLTFLIWSFLKEIKETLNLKVICLLFRKTSQQPHRPEAEVMQGKT